MILFLKPVSETISRVTAVYQDHELSPELQNLGHFVHGVPVAPEVDDDQTAVLFMDTTNGSLFYQVENVETTVDAVSSLKQQLAETQGKLAIAENKLKTAVDVYDEAKIETITLDELKVLKIAALKQLCDEATESGFVSPSLGYRFGFSPKNQDDIRSQVLLFLANPAKVDCQWNTEDAGIVVLTRDQFLNLLPEGEAHTRANIGKLWGLVGQVGAATSKEEVQNVSW